MADEKETKRLEDLASVNDRLLKISRSREEIDAKLAKYSNETLESYRAALTTDEEALILSTKKFGS